MRLVLYLFLITLVGVQCSPVKKIQKNKAAANELYQQGEKLKAALIYAALIELYPDMEGYGNDYLLTAKMFEEAGKLDDAILWNEKVLRDRTLRDTEPKTTSGVLETHENYKHKAVLNLARIFASKNKYDKTLSYYKSAQLKYIYHNHSKISQREQALFIAYGIADSYLRLEQPKFALTALLPYALTLIPSSKYQPTADILRILEQFNLQASFKEEFDTALDNLEIRNYGINLNLYAKEVKVERYRDELLTEEAIKKTLFYKKILAE